ncbi:hypothetical protein [Inquilinus limosus]|uniref:Uncharacterized protein n=1 Tax=Inquilinus limosus TaxID=171674 RepID=A0A211YS69_9PROT|nr:hypothetical protein [Inquilinus limosus]OWJ55860.1 hypothetical protein BWR60_35840 [Inquilinus limosus]
MGERSIQQLRIRSEGERLFAGPADSWLGAAPYGQGTTFFRGVPVDTTPLRHNSEARQAGIDFGAAVDGFIGYYEAMQAAITIQWMQYGFYGRDLRIRAELINHTISAICYAALSNPGPTAQIAKKVAYHIITTRPESVAGRAAASLLTSRVMVRGALSEGSALRRLLRVAPTGKMPTGRGFLFGLLIGISNFVMATYGSTVLLVNDGLRGLEHIVSAALSGRKLDVPLESILVPDEDQQVLEEIIKGDELGELLRELYDWASDIAFDGR